MRTVVELIVKGSDSLLKLKVVEFQFLLKLKIAILYFLLVNLKLKTIIKVVHLASHCFWKNKI